jgi:hypothetical protein
VSSALSAGDSYEVLDAMDFFGTPVTTGSYNGTPISGPVVAKTPPASVSGMGTMPSTSTAFKAIVLRKTS